MKLLKNKTLIITIVLTLVVGLLAVTVYFFRPVNKSTNEKEAKGDALKDTTTTTLRTDTTELPQTTMTTLSPMSQLSGVSLTTTLMREEVTLAGKTYPAGSVVLLFYANAGKYNVLKKVGEKWSYLVSAVYYSGTGGFSAGYLEPTEDNVSLKIQRIENGKVVSESKEFVVLRSELGIGIKTYN